MISKQQFIKMAVICAVLLNPAVDAVCSESGATSQKVDEFLRAAQLYIVAADVRFANAQAHLTASKEERELETAGDKERNDNLNRAANNEIQAANLFVAASGGYDRAAAALSKAAAEHKKNGNKEESEELNRLAESLKERGTAACERAAMAHEAAAEAYSSFNRTAMAASNDNAAKMRETLAARLK